MLTADTPLHLEDHLDAARFSEDAVPSAGKADMPKPVEWRFDQPQPDWKATPLWNPPYGAPVLTRIGDGLRITLGSQLKTTAVGRLRGAIRVDVPNWDRNDWAEVVVRARAQHSSSVNVLGLGFNLRDARGEAGAPLAPPFQFGGEETAVARDGTVRTYRLRINVDGGPFQGTWRQLFLSVGSDGAPGSIDILSVTVVPKGAVPAPTNVEWRFDQPQPDWKPNLRRSAVNADVTEDVIERAPGALRVMLPESSRQADKLLHGGTYVDLPGWRREEWAHIIVRARTASVTNMTVGLNPRQDVVPPIATQLIFARGGGSTPIISDGSVQTYQIRPYWGGGHTGPWMRVGFEFSASEPGSIDILSVTVVPIAALYADERAGARSIAVGRTYRRSVFTHAPGRLAYRVRVPEGGRLQAALGVLSRPVDFRVTAQTDGGEATTVFQETHLDPEQWAERTVDLSSFAGKTITLGLETTSSGAGTVAFWGSPMISGSRRSGKPNVILYVIDGGSADDMSVYGYNRRTTPNLERLAAQGVVFEHAYSNSSWTKPSTASFMTSLHTSVLGFTGERTDQLPEQGVTMAERFHRAGYQTAVLTANPNAATLSGLERWADLMHEPPNQNDATSSVRLHTEFWNWRTESSGQPYWAHFQPTDVHAYEGGTPTPIVGFSGMFVTTHRRREFFEEWDRFNKKRGVVSESQSFRSGGLEAAGVDRGGFFETMRALYDESLAHQDYQIGRLVERLRERGEWENTLLVIAGDHAIAAALWDLGSLMQETLPTRWNNPMLASSVTRVPLIFVWPGHIAGGRRFEAPVSMIDVLPTVLDLVGLPKPDVLQGQSLAPLLRGQPGWTSKPVIFDEVVKDPRTGELVGRIEVIDGRWGASLWIGPQPADPEARRPWPLLLYDVWADPFALHPVNEQHPALVDKYTKFLLDQWKAHQGLAKQFKPGPKVALTPEQLERLRSLGYIR